MKTEDTFGMLKNFSEIFDAFDEGLYVLDKNWRYIYVNQQAAKLVGRSREALIGQQIWQLFPSMQGQPVATTLRKAMQEHTREQIEIFDSPTQKWFTCSCCPIEAGLAVIVRDMTASKQVEEGLREKVALINLCYDAIIVHNYEGKILFWNASAEKLYKWSAGEVTNKNIHHLLKTQFPGTLDDVRRQMLREGCWEGELIHRCKDGSSIAVDSRWAMQRCLYGQDIIFLEANRDITERKELEQRKGEFISMTSHELKTPITTIKAFTQFLEKRLQPLGDQQINHFLDKMDTQINRLTRLVNELLDVSRLEEGKLPFHEELFDLDSLVRATVEQMQMTAGKHKLLYTGEDEVMVYGDQMRIEQVLIDLLSNAIKYSPRADKVLIRLSARPDTVTVSIRDFGIGIDPARQHKIFERFYQVEPLERKFPGLGIGLYICREIIQRHGGQISVESQLGEGATFSFTLPRYRAERTAGVKA